MMLCRPVIVTDVSEDLAVFTIYFDRGSMILKHIVTLSFYRSSDVTSQKQQFINKTDNVRINVIWRRVRVTIVAVEKQ